MRSVSNDMRYTCSITALPPAFGWPWGAHSASSPLFPKAVGKRSRPGDIAGDAIYDTWALHGSSFEFALPHRRRTSSANLLVLTKYYDDTREDESAAWNGG
jgi:hypothetical protein